LEDVVVEQFEGCGVSMTRAGEAVPEDTSVDTVWELALSGDQKQILDALAVRTQHAWGAHLGKAKDAVNVLMDRRVASVKLPGIEDERAFIHEMALMRPETDSGVPQSSQRPVVAGVSLCELT
jgi:hypothetical protein